jgi:hypothetical protein
MNCQKKYDDPFPLISLINDSESILNKINKSRKSFMLNVFELYLCIQGKINFSQLSEYGGKSTQYYYKHFKNSIDIIGFNKQLIQQVASKKMIFEIRLTKIPRNRKSTYGVDLINPRRSETDKNGTAFVMMTVFDIENETSFHLKALQLPTLAYLKKYRVTVQDYALSLVGCTMREHPDISQYLYVDEFFIKSSYLNSFKNTRLHLVSPLKEGVTLYYMHHEKPGKKVGRPTIYGGKVDFNDLDSAYFKIIQETDNCRIFSAILMDKTLRQKLLVVVVNIKESTRFMQKRYFSTDETLEPLTLLKFCKSPIHTETLLQDAVQHSGLHDFSFIDQDRLTFHVNASLTAVNIAKAELWLQKEKNKQGVFSMEKAKRYYYNKYQLRKREDAKYLKKENKHTEQADMIKKVINGDIPRQLCG